MQNAKSKSTQICRHYLVLTRMTYNEKPQQHLCIKIIVTSFDVMPPVADKIKTAVSS